MAAQDKVTREIEIIANGQKYNASLKEMTAAQGVLNSQIYKMAEDDPRRAELIRQYQELKKRVTETWAEVKNLKQSEEELAEAQKKVHAENERMVADGKNVTASLNEMKVAAGILEKQLSDMGQFHPDREQMIKDFQELKKRISETKSEFDSYKQSPEEVAEAERKLHEENLQIIADGKKIHASMDQMRAAASQLEKELSAMARNDPNRAKLIQDLGQMKKNIAEAEQEVGDLGKGSFAARLGIDGVTNATGLLKAGFRAAVAAFLPLLAFQSIVEWGQKLLGIVGNVDKIEGAWQRLGVSQETELNRLYTRTEAFSQTFGKEHDETIKAANVLAKEFGITYEQAFDLMEKGFLAGGDSSGEMLDNIKEYSVQFASAGASAEDFVAELVKSEGRGIFSDKAPDVVKEFGLRIREQTVATTEALDAAFGQGFTDRIFKGINDGTMTTVGALREVSREMNNTTVPASKLQTVIADVFGGPGEDAGLEYLRSLQDLGGELDSMVDMTNTLTESQYEQLKANQDLAEAESLLGDTFAGTGSSMNVLWTNMKTFGLVVTAGLVQHVIDLKDAAVGAWESIKAFGSGIAEVWGKLKSGDLSGAASEFGKLGERSSKAYYEGFYSARLAKAKEQEALKKQEEQKALAEATEQARLEGEATRKEKSKAAEKARKEAEREQRKALEELKKAREEFNKAELQAELEVAKLKVEVMEEGIDKTIAKLRHQFELEDKELEKRKQSVIDNAVATEEEKNAAVALIQEQQLLKSQELADAERAAREEQKTKDKEEAAKELEEKLAKHDEEQLLKAELAEIDFLNNEARLEEQSIRALEAEQARDMALLELKKATAAAKLADMEAAGQGETTAATKLKNEILKVDKEISDTKIANAKKTAEFKAMMVKMEADSIKFILDVGLDFLATDEAARKKNATAIKAFTMGKIIADLMTEVAGYMAHPASIGTFGLSGEVKSVIATARAGIALEKVRTQAFADGGMTDRRSGKGALINMVERIPGMWEMASGQTGGSIGSFADGGWVNNAQLGLIGERGRELVLPNWVVESPKYANLVGYLDGEIRRGARAFADGGMTSAGAPLPAVDPSGANSEALLMMLASQMVAMNETLQAWPTKLQVINNPLETQEGIQVYNELVEISGG